VDHIFDILSLNPTDLNNYITLLGNIIITSLLLLIGLSTNAYARAGTVINEYNRIVLHCLANIFFALALRIGWWIPGLIFASPSEDYHRWTLDYKWAATSVATLICLYSIDKFFTVINKYSKKQRILFYTLNIVGAIFIASLKLD
jgi:hypothetical protein